MFQVSSSLPTETIPFNKSDIRVETVIEEDFVEIVGVIDESLNRLEQDDPLLVKAVREKYLIKPTGEPYNLAYNLGKALKAPEGRKLDGQFGQGSTK